MANDHDNFDSFNSNRNDYESRNDTMHNNYEGYESDPINNQKQVKSKKFTAPWNNKFGEDENFKNRQYSRSARNQPEKEATALSKVLLFVLILALVAPFILYAVVNSQRNSEPIEPKTTQQVKVSTTTTVEETTTTKEKETTEEEEEETRELETTTTSEEQVTTQAPQPQVTTAAQTQRYHTVAAGESWWSISQAYGVDVYELAAANGTSIDGSLMPGSQIIIP